MMLFFFSMDVQRQVFLTNSSKRTEKACRNAMRLNTDILINSHKHILTANRSNKKQFEKISLWVIELLYATSDFTAAFINQA